VLPANQYFDQCSPTPRPTHARLHARLLPYSVDLPPCALAMRACQGWAHVEHMSGFSHFRLTSSPIVLPLINIFSLYTLCYELDSRRRYQVMAGKSKRAPQAFKATGNRRRTQKAKTRPQPDADDSSGEVFSLSVSASSSEHSSEPGSHSKKRGRGPARKQAAKADTSQSQSQPSQPTPTVADADALSPLPSFSRSQTAVKSESSQSVHQQTVIVLYSL
jgi:hypothetical protein